MSTRLSEFNEMSSSAAGQLLGPCLDLDRWGLALLDTRPDGSIEQLTDVARTAADPFTEDEVEHHYRVPLLLSPYSYTTYLGS